jgi:ornithine carbamoyltransferase
MRHFISLDDVSPSAFADLLTLAAHLKRRRARGERETVAAGRTLAMVFEKPSLRTRLSFELAWTELGGHASYVKGDEVGLDVREPTPDVARVLGRYVHAIMARVYRHRTVELLAQHSGVPVVNGLSDLGHPCQALGDFQTIAERFRRIAGLKVVFVGDANNVSRSLARACVLAGSEFVLARPDGYAFTAEDRTALGGIYGAQVREERDPAKAVEGAHVLYTDVWTSMGQEAEKAERLRAFQGYQIDAALIARARPDAIVMHCLPAHRGEEITGEAMEHPRSAVWDQAENRLHAQQAVLRTIACPQPEAALAAAKADRGA